MEKMNTDGTILRKRIKEMGYTQQEFADKVPMPRATLKKYMSDRGMYSIDYLKRFGELLGCSYDYLMGATVSPRRDIQHIIIKTEVYETIAGYLNSDGLLKPIEDFVQNAMREVIGDEKLSVKLDNVYALAVIQELNKCKNEMKGNQKYVL